MKWPVKGLEHIRLEPGTVVVLAAPRRTGKTTFAINLARNWSREHRVVLSTTESNVARLLDNHPDLKNPNLLISDTPYPMATVLSAAARTISADVLIVDELGFLRSRAPIESTLDTLKTLAVRHGFAVVAICGRSPMIDTIIDADAVLKVNAMPNVSMAKGEG